MQLQQNPHVSSSSSSLSVTCTANLVKCTLGIPIFLKIELCSCSPRGDPDKWQCRLITHPLVYSGLSLHATLQVRSAAICCCVCGQSLCTRMFVSAGSANQEAQRRDAHWKSIVQQTQVNIHPSWCFCIARDHDSFTRRLNYSWNKTHSPSWEKMKTLIILECKDNLTLFLNPPLDFPSFKYVPTFFFVLLHDSHLKESQQKQSLPIPTNSDRQVRMRAWTSETVNTHTVIKPSGYQTSWLRPPWG